MTFLNILIILSIKKIRKLINISYKGQYTYDVHEKCLLFKTPHPPPSNFKLPPQQPTTPPPPHTHTHTHTHTDFPFSK